MNGYVVFYNSKRVEIYAETLYAAKVKAIEEFRKTGKIPKSREHMVSVWLAEKDGKPVIHDGS
jgi:hypothetical protein